jgi:glycine dehydrogenase subunit 1
MFIPHTAEEREAMLKTIGVEKLEDLFADVPKEYRFPQLDLPPAFSEMEALSALSDLAEANEPVGNLVSFLGAGAYHHYVPAAVDALIRRGEIYSAYTPYQPEVSQGTLQAIFEYQSLIAALTGMDVSNASHYDGATAMAEAGVLAYHHFRGKRGKFLLSPAIHPQYREVFCTYLCGYENFTVSSDDQEANPFQHPDDLAAMLDQDTALVVVQYPDFFGRIFDFTQLAETVHQAGALLAVVINPTALGLLKPPGEFGADIVVGEGQPLGIPMSFGGPYLGLFATKNELVRRISGRLVGETVDADGETGYVLTLTAREQHIRRERATSNICTNQGLMATASAIYLSLLGKHGLRKVAELCYHKAHYAADRINQIPGYSLCVDAPFFHEFVVCCPRPVADINQRLLEYGFLGGYDLGQNYPSLKDHMLVAVTETVTRQDIDNFCSILEEVNRD